MSRESSDVPTLEPAGRDHPPNLNEPASPMTPLDRLAWSYSIGGGLGLVPKAPGTAGSLLGPLLVWSWQSLDRPRHEAVFATIVALLCGVFAAHRTARRLQLLDPGCVVIDEILAFPIVFLMTPVTWTTAIIGFVWFRVFDIVKPWPIRKLEQLPGGWGIMADDQMAGVFAALALHGTARLLESVT
jgi:phosphatidylglycerophosphatase A